MVDTYQVLYQASNTIALAITYDSWSATAAAPVVGHSMSAEEKKNLREIAARKMLLLSDSETQKRLKNAMVDTYQVLYHGKQHNRIGDHIR